MNSTQNAIYWANLGICMLHELKVGIDNTYMHKHMQCIAPVLHPQLLHHYLGQNALVGALIRARPSRIWRSL